MCDHTLYATKPFVTIFNLWFGSFGCRHRWRWNLQMAFITLKIIVNKCINNLLTVC